MNEGNPKTQSSCPSACKKLLLHLHQIMLYSALSRNNKIIKERRETQQVTQEGLTELSDFGLI